MAAVHAVLDIEVHAVPDDSRAVVHLTLMTRARPTPHFTGLPDVGDLPIWVRSLERVLRVQDVP
jgi:hypothetical protein